MDAHIFTIFSYAAAVFSLCLGIYGLVSPNGALDLIGLRKVDGLPHSISEVRATYGGVFMGASLYPLVSDQPHAFLALAAAWTLAGICRLASVVFDGAATRFNLTSVAIELAVGALIAAPYLSRL